MKFISRLVAKGPATLLACAALAVGSSAWSSESEKHALIQLAQEMAPFSVRVVGPPVNSQEWNFIDKGFWKTTVAELSAGKLKVQHNSVTELNVPPSDVFQLTARGTFDLADVTANYGAGELVALDGIDLAGVASSMEIESQVLQAYHPVISKRLKERFRLELLGLGVGGPQVFFCRQEVRSLDDLRGLKIRVSSSTLADFLSGLDLNIMPISMSLSEVLPALQRGVVDCVITGAMAGNVAKLHEVSSSLYTLILGWSPKARIANSRFIEKLDATQREWLFKMTQYYYEHVNNVVQKANLNEGIWCTVGDSRCTMGGKENVTLAKLVHGDPTGKDLEKAKAAVAKSVLPSFGKACGNECAADWDKTVGPIVGLKINAAQ